MDKINTAVNLFEQDFVDSKKFCSTHQEDLQNHLQLEIELTQKREALLKLGLISEKPLVYGPLPQQPFFRPCLDKNCFVHGEYVYAWQQEMIIQSENKKPPG